MLWNLCIRRPVLTIVVFLIIGIFGMYGYFKLPVRENPDIEFPITSVNVVLPGAEPEVMESEIIKPLEEQINTIEGLKELNSTAREEVAIITAEFELWRDIDVATQDVRDRVDRARRELPDEIEAPIVRKLDPDAQAIMWIALTGDESWDAVRLTRYADEVLKERLENIRGVGQILIGGEKLYAVRVRLDADRLAAHRLTVQDVVDTIRRNNVKIPSGRIESEQREFLVKTEGQFSSPGPMNDLIITEADGAPIRIADVGEVADGVENDRQLARFVEETAVGIGVVKQSDANTVALSGAVRQRMRELEKDFAPGLKYTIATDNSVYIEDNIRDLLFTIGLATILVVIVVLIYLRSLRGTIITSLAIPTSLLGGLALIYALGFSLNVLTLLAMILAIGIVLDDAIVVLENSYRHLESGQEPREAARIGVAEVAFPNIANTLSLVAVFLPVAFTAGIIGRFFFEFGLTVACTVFISTFTALSLTPMLCSRLLREVESKGRISRGLDRALKATERGYGRLLERAFAHRALTVIIGLVAFGLGLAAFTRLSTEFIPAVDRSEFMIRFETPEGSTLKHTDTYARRIEEKLRNRSDVEHFFLAIGLSRGAGPGKVNEGLVFVHLLPRDQRDFHQRDIMQDVRKSLSSIPGGQAYVVETSAALGGGSPLQVVLQHEDLDELAARQEDIMNWMRGRREFLGVNSDLKMNKPQVRVRINRDKASQMGISVADISNTMRYLLGEPDISEIEQGNERYEVIPEVMGKGQMVPSALRDLYVRNSEGALVRMANLVETEEVIGPSAVHHFNRLRAATVSASNPPDVALGDAINKLTTYLDENLSAAFDYAFTGQAQDFQESFYYLTLTLIFSVVFVYLVLAAQFESFIQPLTILLALPLASAGAFATLWALGMTFNIFSFIGLIMLMGMATKNGILLIDYTNALTRKGQGAIEAAKEAARIRFRPVVMTTLSTVFGLLPIALGFGAGGEARAPLGVAVAAGLLVTTFLTLLVVPVGHTLIDGLRRRATRIFRGGHKERDTGEGREPGQEQPAG